MLPNRSIAFIASGDAFLPELEAYRAFFSSRGWMSCIFRRIPKREELEPFAVEWHILGVDRLPKVPRRVKVHEYASVSAPPFPGLKNRMKRIVNTTPDIRIFQNEFVANELGLFDRPYFFRDMGVSAAFFQQPVLSSYSRPYTFVYAGSLGRIRGVDGLIRQFLKNFRNETMLILGQIPERLKKYRNDRLHLEGPVPYDEVPGWLAQAEYGINLNPFIYQTSTKVLEYCATGLKIITTDYPWVRAFEQERNARFFKLEPDGRNFNWEAIRKFEFRTPEVGDLLWENILESEEFERFQNELGKQMDRGLRKLG